MSAPYYRALDERNDSGRYVAGEATAGPWSPQLQHGGPPNALAVIAAQRCVKAATGRDDLVAVRICADFVGPVPVAHIETHARVVRAARSAVLAEVVVAAGERDCLHTRVWFVRAADTSGVASDLAEPPAVPDAGTPLGIAFGYGASLDWRFVSGAMTSPGPAAAWVRPQTALLEDAELSGLARAVLVADSASGISAELDWSSWSFVNVDLDVHLARPFEGEWVLMDAVTLLGGAGSAMARSTLSDRHGVVGAGLQTLVLSAHPT